MAEKNARQQEYAALARQREVAALAVVGAVRAIFKSYPISEKLFQLGVNVIKNFDRVDKEAWNARRR